MTGCKKYHELINLAVDGEISAHDEKQLNAHLLACPECSSLLDVFKRISAELSDMQVEPPQGLVSGVMREIRRQTKRKGNRLAVFGRVAASFAAVVIMVIAANRVLPIKDMQEAAGYNAVVVLNKVDPHPRLEVFNTPAFNYAEKIDIDVKKETDDGALEESIPLPNSGRKRKSPPVIPEGAGQEHDVEGIGNMKVDEAAVSTTSQITEPTETPKSSYSSSSKFGIDLRAKDIWAANSFSKAYYCVAVINDTSAGELSGYEQLSKSDSEIYYKVPVEIIEEFQRNKSLTEIMYNNNKAEYGIVIMKIN